jgi:hypothetical protein
MNAIRTLAFVTALLLPLHATAHEATPKHGGVVRTASDMQFELVAKGDATVIYVEDHGKPVPTNGMTGKLTVLQGKDKSETPLVPAGDNRLEAKGLKLASGARAIGSIQTAKGKTVNVRFSIK